MASFIYPLGAIQIYFTVHASENDKYSELVRQTYIYDCRSATHPIHCFLCSIGTFPSRICTSLSCNRSSTRRPVFRRTAPVARCIPHRAVGRDTFRYDRTSASLATGRCDVAGRLRRISDLESEYRPAVQAPEGHVLSDSEQYARRTYFARVWNNSSHTRQRTLFFSIIPQWLCCGAFHSSYLCSLFPTLVRETAL